MDDFVYVRTLHGAIYGKVALVRHRQSGRHFAMKMMSIAHMHAKRAISGPEVCEDGDMELRVLRKLSRHCLLSFAAHEDQWIQPHQLPKLNGDFEHNNLLLLHQDFVDQHTNMQCLVLDYCPYGELYDQVQMAPQRSLGLETARALFQQITHAVRFIHAHNTAHRDISLENVLIDERRQCRLADFGLASDSGSACVGRVGKAFYMAPEVHAWQQHEFYDGLKADIWSLGVLLFIVVIGVPPFETASESDARFRVVKSQGIGQLLCIWQMESRVTDELRSLLNGMLQVDVRERLPIDKVCSHPWLCDSIDPQTLLLEGKFTDNMVETVANNDKAVADEKCGYDNSALTSREQLEPQEELETDNVRGISQPRWLGAASKVHGLRKRMKITIAADTDESNEGGRYFTAEHDGASSIRAAYTSPWGKERGSLLFSPPHTTPTACPRPRSKVTLRSLFPLMNPDEQCLKQATDTDHSENVSHFDRATRRRRTSLSAACAAFAAAGAFMVESPIRGPQYRVCLASLVAADSMQRSSEVSRDARPSPRGVICETCYCSMLFARTENLVPQKTTEDPARVA
ncbi:Camk protein kinase, partial [Globisporangium splendens]